MKWLPRRRTSVPSPEALEVHERLRQVEADDVRVRDLRRRGERILKENCLGPVIVRALGGEGK